MEMLEPLKGLVKVYEVLEEPNKAKLYLEQINTINLAKKIVKDELDYKEIQ